MAGPMRTILTVLVYLAMLILVVIFFNDKGVFIYEGF